MSEWISVKDKEPPKDELLLVFGIREYCENRSFWLATYYFVFNTWENQYEEQFWESEAGYDITEVTHWMELPKEPND